MPCTDKYSQETDRDCWSNTCCTQGWKKPRFLKQKNRFLGYIGFNLQMPDTKLQPTSTMKSKDKSSEQRFGHVNATKPHSYLNIILIELVI